MHGLRHCATMLVSQLAASHQRARGGARLASWSGLPKGCRKALLEAASSGSLTEKNIIPCVVPPKWVRTLSRSTGLQFVRSNVVTSNGGLVDVWRGKTNQLFYRRRHNTVISAHCVLRDLQNLSTSCFAINFGWSGTGIGMCVHTSHQCSLCLGSIQSNLILDAGVMDQAPLRSPVTKHFPEQCRHKASASGIRGAQHHERLHMCVAQHRKASAFVVENPQSSRCAVEKCGLARSLYESASFVWKNLRDLAVQPVQDFLLRGVKS